MDGSGPDQEDSPRLRQFHDPAGLLAVMNGVFVSVGGVYVATGSGLVTGFAGLAAVASAWFVARRGVRSAPDTGTAG